MPEDDKAVLKMISNYPGRAIGSFDLLSSDGAPELTKVTIENKLLHSGNLQPLITDLKRLVKQNFPAQEARRTMKYLYTLIPLLALSCALTAQTAQIPISPHMTAKSSQITKRDPPTCIVTALVTLNLRESPGTDSAVIAVLVHGDQLTLLPDPAQGNWIHIQMPDRNGWVNSNYCQRINP